MLIIEDGIFILKKYKLMLSENNPKKSIKKFFKIKKNLSKIEINNIKFIDLRNIDKTIIRFLIND